MKGLTILLIGLILTVSVAGVGQTINPVVEMEADVYSYVSASNGSGPTWCAGSTSLVRVGDALFASGIETLPDAKPLNNVRWMLFKLTPEGWKLQQKDDKSRQREPCPLVCFQPSGGRPGAIFLSTNPTLAPPDAYSGPAEPQVLRFDPDNPTGQFETLMPVWADKEPFSEHSYRSFAADGENHELILFQNIGYAYAAWSFLDREGKWSAQGRLYFPWGAEYPTPEYIRVCYPNVALKNRAVHFVGVSDIVEPYPEWRAYKKELTGQDWDYDFRRLFYTWSDDITSGTFNRWIEIASRDKTCGWISPCDLWVDNEGTAHILWLERRIDTRLREKFFPNERNTMSLRYAQVRNGHVRFRRTLLIGGEGASSESPGNARFQITPDQRVFVFCYVSGSDAAGNRISENRVFELFGDGRHGPMVKAPLERALTNFFTATWRGGSPLSDTIELLSDSGGTMRYARVRLERGGG